MEGNARRAGRQAILFVLVAALAGATVAGAEPSARLDALFAKGFNACSAVQLSVLQRLTGQSYQPGVRKIRPGPPTSIACNYATPGDSAAATIVLNPPSYLQGMQSDLVSKGTSGVSTKKVSIPGALLAEIRTVLVPGRLIQPVNTRKLYAAYRQGVVEVDITQQRAVPDSLLIRVLKLAVG